MAIDLYQLYSRINSKTHIAPLVTLRVLFGIIMFFSMVRFWYHGWIEKLYVLPSFHFHYYGFDFVQVPGLWTYGLFVICSISALTVAVGYKYHLSIVLFFLSFTYIELMDMTTYLNHYYFISVLSFILIWLPAHTSLSIDARLNSKIRSLYLPRWNIDVLKIFLAIVYIYAGAAKLNYDWMINAMPLSIWLPTKLDIPILSTFMNTKSVHYLFSWGGAIYDLGIVFLLLYSKTRTLGYFLVVIFHLLTGLLFSIGMFPYVMIVATLIFFSADFHLYLQSFVRKIFNQKIQNISENSQYQETRPISQKFKKLILFSSLFLQIIIPLRFLLYPGNVFWTEQGYRFSWRVMLMEKTGYANFKIVDGKSGKRFYVRNDDFLSSFQEKQMSTQPDFIVQYAHYLGEHFKNQGHQNVEVYVESYVSLNGRKSRPFIDPNVDLMTVADNFNHKYFILPFEK